MADLDRIQKFYIAYYGRAGDTVGMNYWATTLDTILGGNETEMVKNFGSSSQPEYQGLFGTNAIADFITLVYENLFNRAVEADGLNYWLGVYNDAIVQGQDPNLIRANMVAFIMDGAQGDDATSVANKLTVANAFTAAVDTADEITAYSDVNNTTGQAEVRALLKTVDSDAASVTAAIALVDPTMDAVVAGYTGNTGVTLALTIGEDVLNGSESNDTFNAPIVQDNAAGAANTLESFDILDGRGGTDTLNATIDSASPAPVLKNIENVNLRFTTAQSVDLTSATGVTTLKVANSTANGFVDGVGSIANLVVANQLKDAHFGKSTATTLGLNLDTVGNTTTPTQVLVNLGNGTAHKATTLNVTAKDANVQVVDSSTPNVTTTLAVAATGINTLKLTEAVKATTVTVTGKGSADMTGDAFTGALTKFDASANEGGVKADIQSTKAAVVTTGAGADTIDMDTAVTAGSSAALGAGNDKLFAGNQLGMFDKGTDGGEGTDIINITDGATLDPTNSKYISNFETLDVSGGTGTYDVSLNDFATVQIDEAINGGLAGAVEFKNAADTFTLNVASKAKDGDFNTVNNVTVTGKDYTGTTAKGTAETFTLVAALLDGNKDNAADGNIEANTLTVNGVENLVVEANVATLDGGTDGLKASKHTLNVDLFADKAETLTVKGDASVDLAGVADIGVVTQVNASGSTGNVTVNLSGQGNSVAYTGSAGVDTYFASATGDTIYTGMGADVVDLGASFGLGRDTFVLKVASDSQVTDTSKDGKITLAADTGYDEIFSFDNGGGINDDRIDVTNLSFSGAQRGVENVSAKVSATTDLTSIVDLFSSVAGDRGIAFSAVGGDSYVMVDNNKDGDFTAADDSLIKLTGVASISEVDINF